MNITRFPEFPGFINSEAQSAAQDNIRLQTNLRVRVTNDCDIENEIKYVISQLQMIETPEHRAIIDKDTIDRQRKMYTTVFKNLLMMKESQNMK